MSAARAGDAAGATRDTVHISRPFCGAWVTRSDKVSLKMKTPTHFSADVFKVTVWIPYEFQPHLRKWVQIFGSNLFQTSGADKLFSSRSRRGHQSSLAPFIGL
jgi:hypothetical protein